VNFTQSEQGLNFAGNVDCTDADGDTLDITLVDSTHPQIKVTPLLGSIYSDAAVAPGSTVDYSSEFACCDTSLACDYHVQPNEVQRPPSEPTSSSSTYGVYDNAPFPLEFDVFGSVDPNGHDFDYMATSMPPGATLDPVTGHFSWDPTCSQNGTWGVYFYAEDEHGAQSDTYNVTIIVNDGC